MVLAYHVIWGVYGFWLPNDPRGSWSSFVYAWELFRDGGPATKTDTRRSVAGNRHNAALRQQTKEHLKYPAVVLTDDQIASAAPGFQRMVEKANYQVFLGRYRYKVETLLRLLKAEASATLREDKLHPMQTWPLEDGTLHTPWAEKGWKVFLDSVEDIDRAVGYVEDNPEKEGRLRQLWPFVVPWRSAV